MSTADPEPFEVKFEDDDVALGVRLPIAPFGDALFLAPDISEGSRSVLRELIEPWDDLWPKMLKKLKNEFEDYGVDAELGRDDFIGSIQRCKVGDYMSDKSKVFLRLEFDEPPLWDFFLSGKRIVHFQPVF